MTIDFLPSAPVVAALAACGLLPIMLLLLSHGPARVAAPGRRFVVACASTWFAWVGVAATLSPGWVDLITGALLLATATLAGFTLWTLIAWGFTVHMLLALDRADRPLVLDEWAGAYTGGKPLASFARDRLGVLVRLGLAVVEGRAVRMTPLRGRLFARAAVALRSLFGLPK